MYRAYLECDHQSFNYNRPTLGDSQFCRTCGDLEMIIAVRDVDANGDLLPVKSVEQGKWTESLTTHELSACFEELMKGYHKAVRLEKYEYAKYGKYNRIDYSFGTELFELTTDIITAGAW
jgi:hypothetical protein